MASLKIWAIADLHLAKGVPEKNMDVFGVCWTHYMERIELNWRSTVLADDLVLIAGDISWAMNIDQAKIDLDWIDSLPGTKVMIRGNHDYWWSSASKVRAALPPSLNIIQNDAFEWHDYSIAGARLWDTSEYTFGTLFSSVVKDVAEVLVDQEKIFVREINRLELSLKSMQQKKRLVMTHYPPISVDLKPSRISKLLEEYEVSHCVFGHLHNIKKQTPFWGKKNGVDYIFTAADFLEFKPYCIILETAIGDGKLIQSFDP